MAVKMMMLVGHVILTKWRMKHVWITFILVYPPDTQLWSFGPLVFQRISLRPYVSVLSLVVM